MRRARHILNWCLAGFIASACTETELVENNATLYPIQFSVSASGLSVTNSRSTDPNDDDSEAFIAGDIADLANKRITLYGTEYANGAITKTWDFMNGWNATVSGSIGNYAFDYTTENPLKYYKPQDGLKYDFRAVFPALTMSADEITGVLDSENGFPYLKILLEYRPDLMVAVADGAQKPANNTTTIPFRFEHQLALITFKIYKDIDSHASEGVEGHDVYLNKMTLKGRTVADFNVVTKEFSSMDAISGATIRVPGYPYSDFKITKDAKKIRDIFLFASNGSDDTEQYTFDFIINEKTYTAILPANGKQWEKGKHYIYTMKVVGSDVYIELGNSDDESMKLIQEKWDDQDMEEEVGIIEGK